MIKGDSSFEKEIREDRYSLKYLTAAPSETERAGSEAHEASLQNISHVHFPTLPNSLYTLIDGSVATKGPEQHVKTEPFLSNQNIDNTFILRKGIPGFRISWRQFNFLIRFLLEESSDFHS